MLRRGPQRTARPPVQPVGSPSRLSHTLSLCLASLVVLGPRAGCREPGFLVWQRARGMKTRLVPSLWLGKPVCSRASLPSGLSEAQATLEIPFLISSLCSRSSGTMPGGTQFSREVLPGILCSGNTEIPARRKAGAARTACDLPGHEGATAWRSFLSPLDREQVSWN